MRNSTLILVAIATIAATPASSQPAPPPAERDDIVVIGRSQADREQQVNDFVRALSVDVGNGPLGRFDLTAVCPAAVGLGERHDRAIAERMRKVAAAAGIRVAKPGCKPNAIVILTADKTALVKAMRKAHPVYFRDTAGRPVEVPNERGPALAWHLEGRVDRSGAPINRDPDNGYDVVNTFVAPSRLSAAVRPIFMASVVVIELESLVGLTTTQVADYAAMRAFARIEPARLAKSSAPTILAALEAPMNSAVPETLTQWDLGYLKGLYAAPPDQHAARQRGAIRKQVAKELAGRPDERK